VKAKFQLAGNYWRARWKFKHFTDITWLRALMEWVFGAICTPINMNLPHMKDPEKRAALEAQHLLGLGETTDIANACIYLLSDASRWVTGTNLFVDGGFSVR
jgi:NAD(P)-dependent dehydrogenase (short-subunit alcohol dehydrogenase family)